MNHANRPLPGYIQREMDQFRRQQRWARMRRAARVGAWLTAVAATTFAAGLLVGALLTTLLGGMLHG